MQHQVRSIGSPNVHVGSSTFHFDMMGRTVRMSRMSVLSKIPGKKCPKFKKMSKNKKKCPKIKLIVQYSDDPGIDAVIVLEALAY